MIDGRLDVFGKQDSRSFKKIVYFGKKTCSINVTYVKHCDVAAYDDM